MKKINNKNINILNIITVIMVTINFILFYFTNKIENTFDILFTSSQNNIISINFIIIILSVILIFIINFVSIFKNFKNKKTMINNILICLVIIISTVLALIFLEFPYLYIILGIIPFSIFNLYFNKVEEKEKKSKVLCFFSIFIIISLFIANILIIKLKLDFNIKYTNNEKDILTNVKQIQKFIDEEVYIPVRNNNKWGYIDKYGNKKIDYIYDLAGEFIEIVEGENKYYIAPVIKENTGYLITKKNEVIESLTNKNADKINKYYGELYSKLATKYYRKCKVRKETQTKDWLDYIRYEYMYESSFEDNEYENGFIYDDRNNKLFYKKRELNINGTISRDNEYSLNTYKNGYLSFYNFKENVHGWVDLKGKIGTINRKSTNFRFCWREYLN